MADQQIKRLQTLSDACTRILKDLISYQKEEQDQLAKIALLKTTNTDPSHIKTQELILAETMAIIPDTRNRLDDLSWELSELLVFIGDCETTKSSIMQNENWKQIYENANTVLSNSHGQQ